MQGQAVRRYAGPEAGMWPHSPAMAFGPVSTRPSTTMPPPTPVPRMTVNTIAAPAPAPSVASERARQLASLANATGRPIRAITSSSNRRPFSQVRLAFLIRPVAGAIAPGMAHAHRAPCPKLPLGLRHELNHSVQHGIIGRTRGRPALPKEFLPVLIEGDDLHLGAAKIDAEGYGHGTLPLGGPR